MSMMNMVEIVLVVEDTSPTSTVYISKAWFLWHRQWSARSTPKTLI